MGYENIRHLPENPAGVPMSFEALSILHKRGYPLRETRVQQVLSPLLCSVEISLVLAGEEHALVDDMNLLQIPITKSDPEPGYSRAP